MWKTLESKYFFIFREVLFQEKKFIWYPLGSLNSQCSNAWDYSLLTEVDDLAILKKTESCRFYFIKFYNMKELNYDVNPIVLNHKDEVISFKCELQENLQKAMKKFVEDHPNWDQYRILQAAIAGFLMQKGFQNRDLTRLYIGNMFSMNFKE